MNSSKYLYYAQMLEGQPAVTGYERGVELLHREHSAAAAAGDAPLQATIRQQIAAAHASVAELYMTDLCFEPDAEVGLFGCGGMEGKKRVGRECVAGGWWVHSQGKCRGLFAEWSSLACRRDSVAR